MSKQNITVLTLLILFLFPCYSNAAFKTVLYTGNGSTQSITGVGFKPDFVWVKARTTSANPPDFHYLWDSIRGPGKSIASDLTDAQWQDNKLVSFDPDGFTINTTGHANVNGATYVAWCWKADQTGVVNTSQEERFNVNSGLSIIKYTGDGIVGRTLNHSLGIIPKMVIVKRLDGIVEWPVYHEAIGINSRVYLDQDWSEADGSMIWGSEHTTSTVGMSNWHGINTIGGQYIAYIFSEAPGVSSIGSYTGNGSTDGPIIDCGFQPAFLIVKRVDAVNEWIMVDSIRDPENPIGLFLEANNNAIEKGTLATSIVDFNPEGFQIKTTSTSWNVSGGSYIYMAFGGYSHQGNLTISGNVGIGKLNPTEALEVNGTIKAKEIVVTMDGWADYVFDKNYPLPDLSKTNNFIKANGHLPGIPSESELIQNGLPVSQILKMQMQKIEELTLHVIELKKQNQIIIQENMELRKQNKKLKN